MLLEGSSLIVLFFTVKREAKLSAENQGGRDSGDLEKGEGQKS